MPRPRWGNVHPPVDIGISRSAQIRMDDVVQREQQDAALAIAFQLRLDEEQRQCAKEARNQKDKVESRTTTPAEDSESITPCTNLNMISSLRVPQSDKPTTASNKSVPFTICDTCGQRITCHRLGGCWLKERPAEKTINGNKW
ncbi:uncharacterized protein AB675_11093 [Cyphellophora attinorum]|uniref:Uncharacterized protein n=1 Tax=Cyphellophora attinorum TaxID=1664694 RepID=A0A0N1HMB8_9EURO|nr:uncharacterized protein AB675_11093 [Phialophora attinorum]KPI35874.1 hypothetical protein AB675_11093 [Phialophora attinorum]